MIYLECQHTRKVHEIILCPKNYPNITLNIVQKTELKVVCFETNSASKERERGGVERVVN